MKKFTKILEKLEIKKYFKIDSEVSLVVEADSQGEASYISDSSLSSIKNQSGFFIRGIEEITKEEFEEMIVESKDCQIDLTQAERYLLEKIYNNYKKAK
jgi:hypothetical protein